MERNRTVGVFAWSDGRGLGDSHTAIAAVLIAVMIGIAGGCSAEPESAAQKPAVDTEQTAATEPAADSDQPVAATPVAESIRYATPQQTVTQFLTHLKAGHQQRATEMLTLIAQREMKKVDAAINPPGSPTADFAVTDVEMLGKAEEGAHVLSTWSDTDPQGERHSYEIVWILRNEATGWAIAGMATRVFDDEPPLVLNFEDPMEAQQKRYAVDQEMARRNQGQSIRQAQQPTGLPDRR